MSAALQTPHAKAWRTRKQLERMGCELMTRELALEVDGKPAPRKRRRFMQPALMLVHRAEVSEPEPRISTYSLVMACAAILILLGAFNKGGFFDRRPVDRAVSTIDYSAAPHLTPIERIKP